MPEAASLPGFVVAALIVLLIPGPAVLYVVARSLSQGHRAGLVSVLGLSAGALVHVAAAAAGLSAILLASATAFSVVKTLGAAYLIYLGVRAILNRRPAAALDASDSHSAFRLFTDGVTISILNPKIAMFFLAFLPQFVDPVRGSVPQQVMLFGFIYVVLAIITDGAYAFLSGHLGGWFKGHMARGPIPRYAGGAVYIGLGVGTALVDRQLE